MMIPNQDRRRDPSDLYPENPVFLHLLHLHSGPFPGPVAYIGIERQDIFHPSSVRKGAVQRLFHQAGDIREADEALAEQRVASSFAALAAAG